MPHATRSARKTNEARRQMAANKQTPLPMEEQQRRAAENAQAQFARYPVPPRYRNHNEVEAMALSTKDAAKKAVASILFLNVLFFKAMQEASKKRPHNPRKPRR